MFAQATLEANGKVKITRNPPTAIVEGSAGDVGPWLRAANAFALPSRTEGLSLALLQRIEHGGEVGPQVIEQEPLADLGGVGREIPRASAPANCVPGPNRVAVDAGHGFGSSQGIQD